MLPGSFRPRSLKVGPERGCFAIDPVVLDKKFKLMLKGRVPAVEGPLLSACVRLLGDPVAKRRVIFRQSGEPTQKARSDNDGCFSLEAAADERFTLALKGPRVPDNGS